MPFDNCQDVILTRDLPDDGLVAGDVGTVVERHMPPDREEGYSVEFFDRAGNPVAVAAVPESSLRTPTAADRPSVRAHC